MAPRFVAGGVLGNWDAGLQPVGKHSAECWLFSVPPGLFPLSGVSTVGSRRY